MSPEAKERLHQKNRECKQRKEGGHRAMLTPRRQLFADLTNQPFNELNADSADGEANDNDYQNGDRFQEIVQPPSMSRANDPLPYPLFFLAVEVGWNRFLPYKGDPMNENPFADASEQPESDVVAIVCDVGPIDHYANFPNNVTEVALMDSNYQLACLRAFDQVTDFYQSQLITGETRCGIVVATALEVDKTSKVRNSLFKEPGLHDAIKIGVTFRKQELLEMAEQNNALREPQMVIVEDNEMVIEPVPQKKRTSNKGFTIPTRVKVIDIPSTH
uniref:Uncharacterized protein n=1 Tax=Oryza punctata TaxID=4537 RepID=A0A0E0LUU5_ORYPU